MDGLRYAIAGLALLCLATGCGESGPELGKVSGTVTLDGEPVEGAFVTFQPLFDGGTECQSAEKTDANGYFEMQYSVDRQGVLVGKHAVSISTADDIKLENGGNKRIKERIPNAYWGPDSTLEFDVQPGPNTADFPLSKKPPK